MIEKVLYVMDLSLKGFNQVEAKATYDNNI